MNFKTTVILIVLLALVGGYVIFDKLSSSSSTTTSASSSDPRSDPTKPKAEKLLALSEADVTGLSVETDTTGKVALARPEPGRWEITEPFKAPADFGSVSMLLSSLLSAETKGDADPSAGTSFKATITAILSAANGQKSAVQLSQPNAVGECVARVEAGGKVRFAIVSADLATALRKQPGTFRDLRLVTLDTPSVEQLVVETPKQTLRLSRDGEGWKIESPIQARADDAAVQEMLSTIAYARASEFLSSTPAGAFDAPQMSVTYVTAGAANEAAASQPTSRPMTPHLLKFGRFEDLRKEKVLVQGESGVATVSVATLDALRKTPMELRDKRVADVRPSDIAKVQITNLTEAATRPNVTTTISRANPPSTRPATTTSQPAPPDSTWMLDGKPADAEKVDALLESFHPLRTTKYLTGSISTQPATPWMVRLTTFDGKSYEVFLGDSTLKYGPDIVEPPAELGGQVKGSFAKPPPPVPFLGAGDATSKPATQP